MLYYWGWGWEWISTFHFTIKVFHEGHSDGDLHHCPPIFATLCFLKSQMDTEECLQANQILIVIVVQCTISTEGVTITPYIATDMTLFSRSIFMTMSSGLQAQHGPITGMLQGNINFPTLCHCIAPRALNDLDIS